MPCPDMHPESPHGGMNGKHRILSLAFVKTACKINPFLHTQCLAIQTHRRCSHYWLHDSIKRKLGAAKIKNQPDPSVIPAAAAVAAAA